MRNFWKSSRKLILEMAQALAALPLYGKVLVAVGLSAWVVLIADWNEIFPSPPPKIEQAQPAEPVQTAAAPADQKIEDRVSVSVQADELKGRFTIADPHVAPDGSIKSGADGQPFFLSEIKRFTSKDVCNRSNGERWACGLHAYATLRNTIEHKAIQCANSGSEEQPKISCHIGGQSVALILVKNGLVELKDDAQDPDLLQAQATAKKARIGIWDR